MINVRSTIAFLCAAFIMGACNNRPSTNESAAPKAFTSKNTDSFNTAFDSVLMNYDSLRTAFINWDTLATDKYAALLQTALISVPYEQLKDEAAATKATSIAQNAADGLQTLINIDSINNKRRFFYTVSESIYHLIKTTAYDKTVIYHKKCPMAFNGDREGWWISQAKKIDNPYFGKFDPKYKNAMLECGSVEDSINNMQ
ncbi:MAG TPA: DUF3347 domain-containing protein [Parafilimonas sp.]|nr:DUF3347 domain-containing protein [Parafilimonas sp.]